MADDALHSLIYDMMRPVTSLTLSRHGKISIKEASAKLNDYYTKNKGKKGLWAVYSLAGRVNDSEKMVLVREKELEESRKQFKSISSETIFSIQICVLHDLYMILREDLLEDYEFFVSDIDQAEIRCTPLIEERKRVTKRIGLRADYAQTVQDNMDEERKKPNPFLIAEGVERPKKEPKKKNEPKKIDIQKMFEKACAREKTPKKKGEKPKPIMTSPFENRKKKDEPKKKQEDKAEEEASPVEARKRGKRKILLDEEDEKEVQQPAKKVEEKKAGETSVKRRLATQLLSSDDEDARSHASPEPMEDEEEEVLDIFEKTQDKPPKKRPEKKQKKEESPVPARRSPRRSPLKAVHDPSKPATRKETTTETFLNEEGYLERREVVKEVQVVEKPKEAPKGPPPPKLMPPKGTKVLPKAQTKISNFFTKK